MAERSMRERVGGIWKLMWKAALTEEDVDSEEGVATTTVMITWAKSNRINEEFKLDSPRTTRRTRRCRWREG